MTLPPWQRAWRLGFVPHLSTRGLKALAHALLTDDPCLVQGVIVHPPDLDIFADADIEAACALAFCVWKGENLGTVGELTSRYEQLCLGADEILGEPAASRHFLDWFDQTPWRHVTRLLLTEIRLALSRRDVPIPVPC